MPALFRGKARFSPSVPNIVQVAWAKCGGTLAGEHTLGVDYFFCDGRIDPWYSRWTEKTIVVFHWRWVSNAAFARFPVPIAPYVLNGYNDTDRTMLVGTHRLSRSEEQPQEKVKTLAEDHQQSVSFDEGTSSVTLVDELSVDKAVKIPFIDFTKVKASRQKPGSRLRIHKIRQGERLIVKREQPSVALPFHSGIGLVPRLSIHDARRCLRHIKITKSALVIHNGQHLGKRLRCGYPAKPSS